MDKGQHECPLCNGSGSVTDKNGKRDRCPLCNGFTVVDEPTLARYELVKDSDKMPVTHPRFVGEDTGCF